MRRVTLGRTVAMSEAQEETALGRLIEEVRQSQSPPISYRALAARSRDPHTGDMLLADQIQRFKGPKSESLKPATIRQLAQALGRPERVVWRAMGETLGLDVGEDNRPEISIRTESPALGALTPSDIHLLLGLALQIAELRTAPNASASKDIRP